MLLRKMVLLQASSLFKVMRLDQDAKIVTFTTVAAEEKEEVGTEIETESEV